VPLPPAAAYKLGSDSIGVCVHEVVTGDAVEPAAAPVAISVSPSSLSSSPVLVLTRLGCEVERLDTAFQAWCVDKQIDYHLRDFASDKVLYCGAQEDASGVKLPMFGFARLCLLGCMSEVVAEAVVHLH
jgi:hypothetical protein